MATVVANNAPASSLTTATATIITANAFASSAIPRLPMHKHMWLLW